MVCIAVSHEDLSHTLCVSRQSISKELKILEREGCVALCWGRIRINDIDALNEKYDGQMGMEQLTAVYESNSGQ
jgi:hypothetical protein